MTDWKAIVAEHGPRVWRTIFRILADHAEAADCYQETFLSVQRADARLAVADWGSYLATIAARRAIDRLRQRMRRRATTTPLETVEEPIARDADPADAAATGELMELVRQALTELPDRQAEVFWLSCVDGMPHDQIANQLQITTGAVRALLHRARASLASALNPVLSERTEP